MDSERVKVMQLVYDDQTADNGKLKPEVKAEWLNRLRSGKFEQTAGALRRLLTTSKDSEQKFGYCCLGVISEMYVEKNANDDNNVKWCTPNGIDLLREDSACMLYTDSGGSTGMPTYDVNMWAFSNGNDQGWYVYVDEEDAQKYARYLGKPNMVYLPQMNDMGASFPDIAEIVEKYL